MSAALTDTHQDGTLTVAERAMAGGYKNPDPYPDRPEKPALLSQKVRSLSPVELRAAANSKEAYDAAVAGYNAVVTAWHEKDNALAAQFEPDLATEHGFLDHPKRKRLFEIAWDDGHSEGFSSVAQRYAELADLLDPPSAVIKTQGGGI